MVHFNNLRLYQRKPEEVSEVTAAEVVQSPNGDKSEALEGVCEQEPNVQEATEDSGYQSCYSDVLQPTMVERCAGGDSVVGVPIVKEGARSDYVVDVDADGDDIIPPDDESKSLCLLQMTSLKRTRESELVVETQESVLQTPRPVQGRKLPEREDEWVVSSLQQIKHRFR